MLYFVFRDKQKAGLIHDGEVFPNEKVSNPSTLRFRLSFSLYSKPVTGREVCFIVIAFFNSIQRISLGLIWIQVGIPEGCTTE